jgi:LPS-assembly protein
VLNAAQPQSFMGTSATFLGDYTQFVAAPGTGNQPEGSRTVLYPQLALPIETTYFSITPKIGVHSTYYDLSTPVSPGNNTFSRTLPIASVDSTVTFERDISFGGRDYIQTLEPRLYYLYVPFQNQSPSKYPVFDTAYYDFNFAQIFAENIFSGQDRIANANQLTAAVTSRLIDPGSGAQVMKAALGQRYYFADQEVILNTGDTARTGKRADIVAAFGGELMAKTTLDTGWQYNPNDGQTERFDFSLRYQPEVAKALGIAWRYKRNSENSDPDNPDGYRDIDITGQWPLWGRWYGVGRYNRSLQDHRNIETIAGLEYNGGCWVLRTAVHQFVTHNNNQSSSSVENSDSTTAFFVSLEFNGLTSLGSSPVSLLRRSVPGYGSISSSRVFSDDYE